MRVGVPTEIKNNEYRVGLTPAAVAELTRAGHDVVVQSGAGLGVDFADSDYKAAGAQILPDAASVFKAADRRPDGERRDSHCLRDCDCARRHLATFEAHVGGCRPDERAMRGALP